MNELLITWRRLLNDGHTCPRCADTGDEVRRATSTLREALRPVGFTVRLVEGVITPEEFERDPQESNRILLAGRSLEDWLGGQVGHSPCCDACGSNDCRTITVEGVAHEAIPADLVIRAGLLAAAAAMVRPPEHGRENCCAPQLPIATIGVRASVP